MIRIIIADDHVTVREGLKRIVHATNNMEVVEEAENSADLLNKMNKTAADIVILDITMPGRSGLDILKELKSNYPAIPVLILSMHQEDRFAIRAFKSGASGYITKQIAASELIKAITQIINGGKYISPAIAEKLVRELESPAEREPHELLSDREFEVMCKLATGLGLNQIAEELSLSISSINTYRSRIMEKMNMKSNVDLARYALEKHLIH